MKLRYALHALTFRYLSEEQRRWALYDAARCCQNLDARKAKSKQPTKEERGAFADVCFVVQRYARAGAAYPLYWVSAQLALAFCPGRVDRSAALSPDLDALRAQVANLLSSLCLTDPLFQRPVLVH